MPAALIPAAIQATAGLVQSIVGGGREARATRKLEKMINGYKTNESIQDYYTKALNKFNANPYTSSLFNYQQQQIGAGTATGIKSLNDRRSAIGGIPALIQAQNDATLKAAAAAEDQQQSALNTLGGATQMKDREDKYKFEAKANLLSQKAGGGAQMFNAGLGNIYGGAGSLSDYYTAKEIYGDKSKK